MCFDVRLNMPTMLVLPVIRPNLYVASVVHSKSDPSVIANEFRTLYLIFSKQVLVLLMTCVRCVVN
jgi:hypothetical protein